MAGKFWRQDGAKAGRGLLFKADQHWAQACPSAIIPVTLKIVESGEKRSTPCSGPVEPHGWPREARLLRRADFQRVYSAGTRFSNPLFAAFLLRTGQGASRVGFTTPRALGKAVQRNRMRRRLREAVRLHLPELGAGWDVVFNPRRALLDTPFARVEQEVTRLFGNAARKAGSL